MKFAKLKVLVSGCFDLLHAGHITFFETAAQHGELYVCLGSDANIRLLKGHAPRFTQAERLYLVQSVKYVHHASIASGSGMLDFEPDMDDIKPDVFVVNEDGASEAKRQLCERKGVRYVVLPREPRAGLPARSSTGLKGALQPPYRLCLAGGWLDQPFVSKFHAGPVITVQVHPTHTFNLRSGLATSTRQRWLHIWERQTFANDPLELAKLLFGYETPPGTKLVAGSQDAIGLTHPGVNRLYYEGGYWPTRIDSVRDPEICQWLEQAITLVELFERPPGYDPLLKQNITREGVARLARAGQECWEGILARDIKRFGRGLTETHRAWAEILPLTTSVEINRALDSYDCHGRVTTGCGGGYIILATDRVVPEGIKVRVSY